ncbi:diacylglycerol kinase family protein [Tessaracoccus sp. OH4464_COT-324]|uniref:diacylglycerol kinase family protein n=1 Tax=Tessaracoccus sp. OH4464_COT-324 TaxID=2491059 RepID=UPI000F6333CC|nr:diacylglycerol kinase family protein [Tessaracoccus sp. OH4464_COT-324]RRD46189.1 phosphatase PAP2 family protein [Tessaracoccus sp. OH4464_COT-324]
MQPKSSTTLVATVLGGLATILWTITLPNIDGWWGFTRPDPSSSFGQVMVIMAGATSPILVFIGAACVAAWASRRRLFNISGALILAMILSWATSTVLKPLVQQPRPDSPFAGIITQQGFGYPSIHVTVWSAAAVMVVSLASIRRTRLLPWLVGGTLAVAAVGLNRLIMGAHSLTDVIGGLLLGVTTAGVANLIADVHLVREKRSGDRTAAVIFNPVKLVDTEAFRSLVDNLLAEQGYGDVSWLPTEAEDPGVEMARRALAAKVDLVLVAGGDGTVRVVLGEFAGTSQRVAVLPAGTGNLLARNLEIPLDLELALRTAVNGRVTPIDIIRVDLPDGPQLAAVMAGIGLDANILDNTDEDLKRAIGPAAYIVAGAKRLVGERMGVTITLDDAEPVHAEATLVSVGNVGELQKGVAIMPDASAQDGLLDVLVATPNSTLETAQMIAELFDAEGGNHVARYTGRRVRLQIDGRALCQIDGDVVGEVSDVTFEVLPGAVQLVLP